MVRTGQSGNGSVLTWGIVDGIKDWMKQMLSSDSVFVDVPCGAMPVVGGQDEGHSSTPVGLYTC